MLVTPTIYSYARLQYANVSITITFLPQFNAKTRSIMSNKTFNYTKTRQECPENKSRYTWSQDICTFSLSQERRAKCEEPYAKSEKSEERRAKSEEPREKSQEPRAKSEEPRAKERRAKSQERRAKSEERRAKSEKRRAKSEERRAKSQERRAKSQIVISKGLQLF